MRRNTIRKLLVVILAASPCLPAVAAEVSPNSIACLIEPSQTVKLATPVPGVLERILVDRGDRVTRGMLVARLESAVEAADLASAEIKAADESAVREKAARADFTESKRVRLDRLRGSAQFVSSTAMEEAAADAMQAQAALQAARTALRLSKTDLEHARARLEQRSVRSPVNGTVVERSLAAGEYAYDQAHVMTIAELDPLNVEAYLPISRYGSIKLGGKAEVRPEAPIGGSYPATVSVIDRVLDSRSGTFGVRLRLANTDAALPGGVRCTLSFSD